MSAARILTSFAFLISVLIGNGVAHASFREWRRLSRRLLLRSQARLVVWIGLICQHLAEKFVLIIWL